MSKGKTPPMKWISARVVPGMRESSGDQRDQVNQICEGKYEVNVVPYWVVRYAVGEYDSGTAI